MPKLNLSHITNARPILAVMLIMTQELWANPDGEALLGILQERCAACHGEKKQKAKFALHDINPNIADGRDIERWEKILEMMSLGDMPPEDEEQLAPTERKAIVEWLTKELQAVGRGPVEGSEHFPRHGNRIDHDALFSGEHKGPAYTTSRLWRISPQIYQRFSAKVDMTRQFNAPLQTASQEGIRDYALLLADEATIKTMLQNCKRAAMTLLHGRVNTSRSRSSEKESKQGRRTGSKHKVFTSFIGGKGKPSPAEMKEVLDFTIEFLLERKATDDDRKRYIDGFLEPNCALAGREAGLSGMLTTIMMSPEFLFRMELGLGDELPDGRRMLSPREIAFALSFALFDSVDANTLKAAEEGRLKTKEDVAREFTRLLDEPDKRVRDAVGKHFWITGKGAGITDAKLIEASYPRLLRFFREFFGYLKVQDVFKDDSRHDGKHEAFGLISDADWLVLWALKNDRQVLHTLLTTDEYFVRSRSHPKKPIRSARAFNIDEQRDQPKSDQGFSRAPIKMPSEQRAGMLTHPAWLAAHSGNFENDPVRRGKWIQEHLLAGNVPDLPIGVAAQLPEEPHRTLRQRFDVVRVEECWRCHRKMNPLGDPFEAYDDFGRFRNNHLVGEDGKVIATEFEAYSRVRSIQWRDSHKKGAPLEKFTTIPVDASGELRGTGDPQLDGKVDGPLDLVKRLAKSDRVRQSFLRHVFRYWMGRNETLNDSPTLMAMDQAYLENDGSFRALLTALVTSDSFLYRK